MVGQPGLCGACSETPKTGFLTNEAQMSNICRTSYTINAVNNQHADQNILRPDELVLRSRHMSHVMRKPALCIYENKDADQ